METHLRIVKTNCRIHMDNLRQLPQDEGDTDAWHERSYRDKAIASLASAIHFIELYAKSQDIEILPKMPT